MPVVPTAYANSRVDQKPLIPQRSNTWFGGFFAGKQPESFNSAGFSYDTKFNPQVPSGREAPSLAPQENFTQTFDELRDPKGPKLYTVSRDHSLSSRQSDVVRRLRQIHGKDASSNRYIQTETTPYQPPQGKIDELPVELGRDVCVQSAEQVLSELSLKRQSIGQRRQTWSEHAQSIRRGMEMSQSDKELRRDQLEAEKLFRKKQEQMVWRAYEEQSLAQYRQRLQMEDEWDATWSLRPVDEDRQKQKSMEAFVFAANRERENRKMEYREQVLQSVEQRRAMVAGRAHAEPFAFVGSSLTLGYSSVAPKDVTPPHMWSMSSAFPLNSDNTHHAIQYVAE
jgi:hypothetical protein